MSDTTETDIRLGFIDVCVFNDGSIRGGMLITDMDTRPYEFRVTSPVKPTQLQQVLYGPSLKEYVYGELICAPLVKAAKEKLSLVLTKDPNLLVIRPLISTPVLYVYRDQRSIKSGDGKDDSIKPVIISTHRNFTGEEAWAQTVLMPIMQRHDLLEPFERVRVALNEVHKQRIEEKGTRG